MSAKVTKSNGNWLIVIESTEAEPSVQDPEPGSGTRLMGGLVAALVVALVTGLLTYGAGGTVVNIVSAVLVGLFFAAVAGLLSGRPATVVVIGLTGGVIVGIFGTTFTPYLGFYYGMYADFKTSIDQMMPISQLLYTYTPGFYYFWLVGFPLGLAWGFLTAAVCGLASTLAFPTDEERTSVFRGWWRELKESYFLLIVVAVIVTWAHIFAFGYPVSASLGATVGACVCAYFVTPIGSWLGTRLRDALAPGLREFTNAVGPLALKTWQPLLGFAVGYIALVVIFAACYATAYRVDLDPTGQFTRDLSEIQQFLQGLDYPISKEGIIEQAEQEGADETFRSTLRLLPEQEYESSAVARQTIGESKDLRFVNFLYFSVMTSTSLGYSNIEPTSPWTQNLASLQGLLAFVWTAVVFALLILHLETQQFGVSRQPSGEESITVPPQVTSLIEDLEAELISLEREQSG